MPPPGSVIDRTRQPLGRIPVRKTDARRRRLPRSKTLDFTMEHQITLNWCWAAVTVSIARFYDAHSTWTQGSIANEFLGRSDCSTANPPSDIPPPCDVPAHLSQVLPDVCFCKRIAAAVPIADCQREIAQGLPIGTHITWAGGSADSGHFVVISGYDLDTNSLIIDDPSPGQKRSDIPYDTFLNQYLHVGTWDRTYYTKP